LPNRTKFAQPYRRRGRRHADADHSCRVTGAANGKKASLPNDATMADLLALATTKLAQPQPAKRVFDASGDELDDDEDGAR